MRLNAKALAITLAAIWGGCVFVTALLNWRSPGYGSDFLTLLASIYPGFHPGSLAGVLVGTTYALLDGAVCGMLVAWLYNKVSARAGSP